jgi:hypothetical protein
MTTEEDWHTVEDGQKLYTKTWKVIHIYEHRCRIYSSTVNYLSRLMVHLKLVLRSYMASATIVSSAMLRADIEIRY